MKILMCIGGGEASIETIHFGGRIAKGYQADVSVLYVQPRLPLAIRSEVKLAREKLSEWEIDVPGVEVLRQACQILLEDGLLQTGPTGEIVQRHALKPGIRGAYEMHVYGVHGEDIRLRLREGDIVTEVNQEVESDKHDLVIFGASKKRHILQKLVQFINCSMLVVKNPKNFPYEVLICTDSSPASRKAEIRGAELARFLGAEATLLAVARYRSREHTAMEGAERASKLLTRTGVRHCISVQFGNVVDEIARHAKENSIVVMGTSRMSELKKFLFGSKPMQIVERVSCPVLIIQ